MRRRIRRLLLVSCAVWIVWVFAQPRANVYATLTWTHFGDHIAHMNVARVFPRIGLDMWRKPLASLFPRLVDRSRLPPEIAGLETAMLAVPGWPDDKPLILSWENAPRNYPPGLTLLVAPVALLYHTTSLGFGGAARLLIALFLVGAHLGLYFFFVAGTSGGERALGWLTAGIAYVTVIHWTLEGFYDALTLAPLAVSGLALRRRRGSTACAAFAAALFVHFRALFFAPWAAWGAVLIVREREWRSWRAREWTAGAVALLAFAASMGAFVLLWPALSHHVPNNAINPAVAHVHARPLVGFVLVTLAAAACFVRARAALDLVTLGWLVVMLFSLRQAYSWHDVVLLAWLALPLDAELGAAPAAAVRAGRLLFFAYAALVLLHDLYWPPWIQAL